jgi:hypothetical protein
MGSRPMSARAQAVRIVPKGWTKNGKFALTIEVS